MFQAFLFLLQHLLRCNPPATNSQPPANTPRALIPARRWRPVKTLADLDRLNWLLAKAFHGSATDQTKRMLLATAAVYLERCLALDPQHHHTNADSNSTS